jgi:serine/threonine-protein kinase
VQDLTGATVGQYEIVEKLGRGGMANVYKAFHAGLAVHRAIKVIRPDLSGSKNFDERFQREARAVAALRHPNIVQMHDFGRHEDLFYMVMEFVDGEDLKARIRSDGPVRPLEESVRIAQELALALGYAHERGVLHRDVKPDNVMLSSDGQVILTDFGIAKVLGSDDPQLTAAGAEIGTPNYMAPELVMGKVPASASSDLYAVGMVLYEMLTAEAPFAADTPLAVLHRVLHDPVTPPREFQPDIPEALQEAVLKAMAFEVEDRYESADALIEGIERGLAGVGSVEAPGAATRPMLTRSLAADAAEPGASTAGLTAPAAAGAGGESRRARRDLVIAGALGLCALALVAVVLFWGWRWYSDSGGEHTEIALLDVGGSSEATRTSGEVAGLGTAEQPPDPGRLSAGVAPTDLGSAAATDGPGEAVDTSAAADRRVPASTWNAPALPPGGIAADEPAQPLASHQGARAGSTTAGDGARDRAGLGDETGGVSALPRYVETGSRTYSGGRLYFGDPVLGELEPEDTVVYDLEVRRPTYIYFDIVHATRPATYTLFDADGNEIFRQGSDLGPFRIEQAGWYRLSIETDADIPIRYEIQFLQVGG